MSECREVLVCHLLLCTSWADRVIRRYVDIQEVFSVFPCLFENFSRQVSKMAVYGLKIHHSYRVHILMLD